MDTFSMSIKRLVSFCALMIGMAEAGAEGLQPRQYFLGVGELMGATQMRHAKLWFAGKSMNWLLAQYELGEIKEGLDDAVLYHPVFKNAPLSGPFDNYMSKPLAGTG